VAAVTAVDEPSANASPRQFLRNALSSYANLVVGIALSLILTRVLLRNLGTSTYGLWIVLLTIVGYLALLDVGVSTAAVQRVARMSAVGDQEGLANVIRTASIFFSVSGAIAVAVTLVVAPFLSSIVHLGSINGRVAGTTLVLLGMMMAVKFVTGVPNAVLFGIGRSDRSAQISLVSMFVTQVAQLLAVLAGGGLIWLGVVTLAGNVVTYVLTLLLVRRLTGQTLRVGHFQRAVLVDLLSFGGRNTVIAISGMVSFSLDALIIGIILPVAQVAPYDIALSTANLTRSLTTYGSDLLLPTYTHFESVKDPVRQARLFSRSVMATLAISLPILVALAAFGDPILKLWLGDVPPKTYSIMIALGFVTALELPGHQCFIFLTGVGRNQLMMRLAVIGAVVNLAGSIAFTFLLGPIGPAIGSLPAVLVISFTVLPNVVCRYLGISFGRYIRDALVPVLPAIAVAGLVAVVLLEVSPVRAGASVLRGGVRGLIEAALVVLAAWAVMFAVVLRIEPDIRGVILAKLRRRGR
jgi:O-antigen/teichoic acid export membrane protein